jgi:hypothetical protein
VNAVRRQWSLARYSVSLAHPTNSVLGHARTVWPEMFGKTTKKFPTSPRMISVDFLKTIYFWKILKIWQKVEENCHNFVMSGLLF